MAFADPLLVGFGTGDPLGPKPALGRSLDLCRLRGWILADARRWLHVE
jgi:hypothetical protein